MKFTAYFIYFPHEEDPQKVNGYIRRYNFVNGIAGPFSKKEVDRTARVIGARPLAIEIEVDAWCPCGKLWVQCEGCEAQEKSEEKSIDSTEHPVFAKGKEESQEETEESDKSEYQIHLEALVEARDEGVFDYLDFTDGKRDKKSVKAAYRELQKLTA